MKYVKRITVSILITESAAKIGTRNGGELTEEHAKEVFDDPSISKLESFKIEEVDIDLEDTCKTQS